MILLQLNIPASKAVTIIWTAIIEAVILDGLFAISPSGPGMALMNKETLASFHP